MFETKRELQKKIDEAEKLTEELQNKLNTPILSTIKSLRRTDSDRNRYFRWLRDLLYSDEWRFLVFELRENTISEMCGVLDFNKLVELNARLSMLNIICNYIKTEVDNYEDQVQRTTEETKRETGLS